jgi:hypothetical protein
MQQLTPPALQGRVSSGVDFLIGTPQSISIAVGAGLISWVNYRILLGVIAVVIAGAALYLATRAEQRPGRLKAAAVPSRVDPAEQPESVGHVERVDLPQRVEHSERVDQAARVS